MRVNKVRAGLTVLGIAVGVFVVTVMSAAVHGINAGVDEKLRRRGPHDFFLTRWPSRDQQLQRLGGQCPWRYNRPLTVEEAKVIERQPSIKTVTMHVGARRG